VSDVSETNAPRRYDLNDEAERARLLHETVGYARVSINRHDGTDRPGRVFAHEALKQAIALGYRLVGPGETT
jgi:hypothetical protein